MLSVPDEGYPEMSRAHSMFIMSFMFVWNNGVFFRRSEIVHWISSSGYICIALRDPVITGRGCICPNTLYRGIVSVFSELTWEAIVYFLLILVEYVNHHSLYFIFMILVEYILLTPEWLGHMSLRWRSLLL